MQNTDYQLAFRLICDPYYFSKLCLKMSVKLNLFFFVPEFLTSRPMPSLQTTCTLPLLS